MNRYPITRARKEPFAFPACRDAAPIRLKWIVWAVAGSALGYGALWLMTWVTMEAHRLFHF